MKVESTIGTDAAPVIASDAVQLVDVIADPRGVMAFETPRENLLTGSITTGQPLPPKGFWWTGKQLKTHFRGTRLGTAYAAANLPDVDPLMQAAGFLQTLVTTPGSESVTYTPLSTGLKTVTCYYYMDGSLYKATGCVASAIALDLTAGGPLALDFTVEGLYQGDSNATFPTIVSSTFGTTLPPTADNVALSAFGITTSIFRSLKINIRNTTTGARGSLNAVGAIIAPRVRRRVIDFTLMLEDDLQSVYDWEATLKAGTSGSISAAFPGVQYVSALSLSAPSARIKTLTVSAEKDTAMLTIAGTLANTTSENALSLVAA